MELSPGKQSQSHINVKKDVVVGCISEYDYYKIEPWVVSLERSGFSGDKIMICYNIRKETVEKLVQKGWQVYGHGTDSQGNYACNIPPYRIVVERFSSLYQLSRALNWKEKYRFIITTDVKDVIFQSDPIKFLERPEHLRDFKKINVGSECLRFIDEPWGEENMRHSYPVAYERMKNKTIYNCGTISGNMDVMEDLFLNIYLLSLGSQVHNPDQAAINVLLSMSPWKDVTRFNTMQSGYAVQLGTVNDPHKIEHFRSKLTEKKLPTMTLEGLVLLEREDDEQADLLGEITPCIVHQYDRNPHWKHVIEKRYREGTKI
jgi:hypothetical protein